MRVTLSLAAILALGLPGLTNALCDLKNENNAVCQKLEDVKYIDSYKLTTLKASVQDKKLRSNSLKNFSSSMKSLDLSDGEIEVVEPGTFLKMTELQDLKMSDNSIAQLKESALEGLNKLKNFELRRNNIRELPPALPKLKGLKNLEISGNPIVCNCATLRVRDELLANGVKISKKVFCMTPARFKGVSLLVPEAEVICMFEEQDAEMQADEAAGSGDAADEIDFNIGELGDVPSVPASPRLLLDPETSPEIITDDLIIPVLGDSATDSSTANTPEASSSLSPLTDTDDFEFDPELSAEDKKDDLIVEGSGVNELEEEEGSGEEGSGTGIWFPAATRGFSDKEDETEMSSTTERPTTTTASWLDVFWSAISGDDASTPSVESESDESLTDGEFIPISAEEATTTSSVELSRGGFPGNGGIVEDTIVTKNVDNLDNAVTPSSASNETLSNKIVEDFSPVGNNEDTSINDLGAPSTREPKRSMGSYVVLAALLGVLLALVGFAAYKSTLCKKKSNEDPERGSELKDVQKSLLDTSNTSQPKIASNGNKENAPLVEPQDTWAGPQEMRQWSDNGQSPPTVDNGNIYTYTSPPALETDPIKPPRKSLPPQEESNGVPEVKTQSPLSTFVPRTHGSQPKSVTPPNSPSSVDEYRNRSPPLSPNTQRVKITLQENPDSVPKTPILITRTKPGVNIVKSP